MAAFIHPSHPSLLKSASGAAPTKLGLGVIRYDQNEKKAEQELAAHIGTVMN